MIYSINIGKRPFFQKNVIMILSNEKALYPKAE